MRPSLPVRQRNAARAARILDAAESATDGAVWGTQDVEFHELIYGLEDRPRMQELIDGLLRRVDRYWLIHGLMLTYRERFEREHRAILAALGERDAARAGGLLEAHLAGAAALLLDGLATTDAEVLTALTSTAVDIESAGFDLLFCLGYVDSRKGLSVVLRRH